MVSNTLEPTCRGSHSEAKGGRLGPPLPGKKKSKTDFRVEDWWCVVGVAKKFSDRFSVVDFAAQHHGASGHGGVPHPPPARRLGRVGILRRPHRGGKKPSVGGGNEVLTEGVVTPARYF